MSGRRPVRLKTYGRQTNTRLNVPWNAFVQSNDKFEELISNCKRYEHPARDDEPISSGFNSASSSDSSCLEIYSAGLESASPPKQRSKKKTIRKADDNSSNRGITGRQLNSSSIDFEISVDKKRTKTTKSKIPIGRNKRIIDAHLQQGNIVPNSRNAIGSHEPPGKRFLRERIKNVGRPPTDSDSSFEFEKLLESEECRSKKRKRKIPKDSQTQKNVASTPSRITGRNKEKGATQLHGVDRDNIENLSNKPEYVTHRKSSSYSSSVEFEKPSVKRSNEKQKEKRDIQRVLKSLAEIIEIESDKSANTDQPPCINSTPDELSGKAGKLAPECHSQNVGSASKESSKALKSNSDSSVTQSHVWHINSSVKIDRVLTKNSLSDLFTSAIYSSGDGPKRSGSKGVSSTPMNANVLPGNRRLLHVQPNSSRRFMSGGKFIPAFGIVPSPILPGESPMKPFLPGSNTSRSTRSRSSECKLNETSSLSLFDLTSIAEDSPQDDNLKSSENDGDIVKSVQKIVSISKSLQRTTILSSTDGTQLSRDKYVDANLSLVFAGLAPLTTSGKQPETKSEILRLCRQETILDFDQAFPKRLSSLTTSKVGEGAYSEVYKTTVDGSKIVVKIIPVGGVTPVSEEKQMTFEDVLSEMAITQTLSQLRENQINSCSSFIQLLQMQFVKGRYPLPLLSAWKRYESEWSTANAYPGLLPADQLYVILNFEDGGSDLEHLTVSDPVEALSIFRQVSCALAVAEKELAFEHRDLHCGNILVSKTKCQTVPYSIDGVAINIKTSGVLVKIIDYTLSRMHKNNVITFTNLADIEDLFNGKGDSQYDVYREMRKVNKNNWIEFCPLTNVLWMNHILEKLTNWTKSKSRNKSRLSAYDELCRKATMLKSCSSSHEFVINAGPL